MKICVAQTIPIKGEITKNIQNHKNLIDLAIQKGADIIIFPELSLTGYEPALADQLSTTQNDKKLDILQDISTAKKIIIGAGLPTQSEAGVCISMIIFEPNKPRKITKHMACR
ncbi:carbon-nitrogen hydrolase family protein [Aquimarina sp. I32.4]|uniref:carbon-nitrogen hydrolase family protein n=1 Tax=Aquimarina sp. I32.4 TaxID=2053903 RepID=UPI000CDED95B|nr:carbon-nitrogen hydrolase family protein [Aquimarina sp. I32.4]